MQWQLRERARPEQGEGSARTARRHRRPSGSSCGLRRLLVDQAAAQANGLLTSEFVAELRAFPGRHDDQVDALTQG